MGVRLPLSTGRFNLFCWVSLGDFPKRTGLGDFILPEECENCKVFAAELRSFIKCSPSGKGKRPLGKKKKGPFYQIREKKVNYLLSAGLKSRGLE